MHNKVKQQQVLDLITRMHFGQPAGVPIPHGCLSTMCISRATHTLAMAGHLTAGACENIFYGRPVSSPVFQVVVMEPQPSPMGQDMTLSDGIYYIKARAAAGLNYLITNSVLQLGSLVRLTQFDNAYRTANCVNISALEVVGPPPEEGLLGNPQPVEGIAPQGSQLVVPKQEPESPAPVASPAPYQPPPGGPRQSYAAETASNAAAPSSAPAGGVQPISSLSPFLKHWCIVARVTKKNDIKRWSNAKGMLLALMGSREGHGT